MLVGKKIIGFGIEQLCMMYPDFDRHVTKKGIDNVIDSWYNLFEKNDKININLEEEFKEAVLFIIYNKKVAPSFNEIVDTMNNIYAEKERIKILKNLEK